MSFFQRDYHFNGASCNGYADEETGLFWKIISKVYMEFNEDEVISEVNFLKEAKKRDWKFVPKYVGFGSFSVAENEDVLERFADHKGDSFDCILSELAYAYNLFYLKGRDYSFLNHGFLFAKYADYLATMHEAGYVHLDVKPGNLLFNSCNWETFLTDFGKCRKLPYKSKGVNDGTPQFMAPEQFRGERLDGRTDVYCLGATIYDLLTGYFPFFEEFSMEALIWRKKGKLPKEPKERNIEISQGMNDLIMRCMQVEPEKRPSMRELAEELRRVE